MPPLYLPHISPISPGRIFDESLHVRGAPCLVAGLSAIAIVPPSPARPVETRAVDVAVAAEEAASTEEDASMTAPAQGAASAEEAYEIRPGSCPSSSDDAEFHPR